jgi:phosphatidylinositol 4-kinase
MQVSLHSLKGRFPEAHSLRDYFEIKYGHPGSPEFRAAQQNFVESMAAYSIICYLLQVWTGLGKGVAFT